MSIKDMLARISGPNGYGGALGRSVTDLGLSLGYEIFSSHGVSSVAARTVIFDTSEEMQAAGVSPRYRESTEINLGFLNATEASLLINLQTAMTAFAFVVASNGAAQYMQRNNTSAFRNGLGPSAKRAMVKAKLAATFEDAEACLRSYLAALDVKPCSLVLNMSKPGECDVLQQFLLQGVERVNFSGQYGFVRGGGGFAALTLSLTEQTLNSMHEATRRFKW